MDIRVLQYCEAVGRLSSFTKAAQEMHVAQPALSMAVAKLEEELGVKLFVRYPRGATPTPEGEVLISRAVRIFDEIRSARREIQEASGLTTGSIKVGFPPMYGLHYFPRLMMAFHSKYPGIEIEANQGSATVVREELEAGLLDIAMLESRRVDRRWESVLVGSDEIVLAVSEHHPLASEEVVQPYMIQDLPMILLSSSYLQRQLFDQYCLRHGVHYRKIIESNFVQMTVQAALAGHGGATSIASVINDQPGLRGLRFEPKLSMDFELCWRKDRYLSKASQAFLDFAVGF